MVRQEQSVDELYDTNMPTIPSKYTRSAILNQGEKKGFGCQSSRFGDYHSISPGPAAYLAHVNTSTKLASKVSLSAKGFGPMPSQSLRFKQQVASYLSPGPGQYTVISKPRKNNHSTRSVSFGEKIDIDFNKDQIPGPGMYECSSSRFGTKLNANWGPEKYHHSAFKASQRNLDQKQSTNNTAVPPVGSYKLVKDWRLPPMKSSLFQRSVGHPTHNQQEPSTAEMIYNSMNPQFPSSPGPGSYETQDVFSIGRNVRRWQNDSLMQAKRQERHNYQ